MRAALVADDSTELELIKNVLSKLTLHGASGRTYEFDPGRNPSKITLLTRAGAIAGYIYLCDLEAVIHEVKQHKAEQHKASLA